MDDNNGSLQEVIGNGKVSLSPVERVMRAGTIVFFIGVVRPWVATVLCSDGGGCREFWMAFGWMWCGSCLSVTVVVSGNVYGLTVVMQKGWQFRQGWNSKRRRDGMATLFYATPM